MLVYLVCLCMHAHVCVCEHVYTFMCACTCVHALMYVYTYIYTYKNTKINRYMQTMVLEVARDSTATPTVCVCKAMLVCAVEHVWTHTVEQRGRTH